LSHVWGSFWQDPERVRDFRFDRRAFIRFWGFVRPYRWRLLLYLLLTAADSLAAVLPALLIRGIIDQALPTHDAGLLTRLVALLAGIFIATNLLMVVTRWVGFQIGSGIILSLRRALYDHLQRMSLAFFSRAQTGIVQSRILNDVNGAENLFTETLSSALTDALGLIATLATMAFLSWQITLAVLVLVPLFMLPAELLGKRMRTLTRARMRLWGELTARTTERLSISGALLVKLFGRYPMELERFGKAAGDVRNMSVRIGMFETIFFGALSLTGSLALVAVYFIGGQAVLGGSLTLGTVIALATLVQRVYGPVIDLASVRLNLVGGMTSVERVLEVLDKPSSLTESANPVRPSPFTGQVELHGVSFRYPAPTEVSIASLEVDADGKTRNVLPSEPSDWILRDVGLVARPGTVTALVGPTGGGKTTLCYLLARLYDPTEGTITLDGHDLRELSFASLGTAIGVVPQDPHLFHDTVAANLRYAKPDASDAELAAACRAAQIHDLIESLPDGYQTMTGERGYRFSGGEKQRLAIARAILKDPAVLILDEATSHLDNETEALVHEALRAVFADRTAFVVAHRLSTVRAADQILVIDGGRVVERGRHSTLIEKAGLYADLAAQAFRA
jgi:ATP-binding cassette subfamily B protein